MEQESTFPKTLLIAGIWNHLFPSFVLYIKNKSHNIHLAWTRRWCALFYVYAILLLPMLIMQVRLVKKMETLVALHF